MPKARHRPAACRDRDCQSLLCEAYRQGREDGFEDGYEAGFAAGAESAGSK
jgi:flagellar biosynthesis/type III secretory pathway protein FliH